MTEPLPVLVLFGDNAVSYNVAAALRGSEYRPMCLLPANVPKWLSFSNVYAVVETSRYKSQEKGYVDDLRLFLETHCGAGPTLTFLCNDKSAYFWIRNRSRLEPFCLLPTPDITPFYDKRLFFKALRDLDLDCADTWSFADREDKPFPYLIKPAYKDEHNLFVNTVGAKVLLVRGQEDLKRLGSCNTENLICQSILDFESGQEYDWWGYRNPTGKIVSVTGREIGKYPDKRGRVTHVELVDEPELKAIGDMIIDKLGYQGIADIQFIRERRTGRFFVIEMNPRMWCSHELLLMAGINLIRLCADDYNNRPQDGVGRLPAYLDGLETPRTTHWYSVLHNIRNFSIGRWQCDEHYGLKTDNFRTRCSVRTFYLLKFIYYLVTRRV
jgi:predicted ATP-grasp superfamily ATP-dependent carboligase